MVSVIKNNIAVILAFALPILLIIGIALSVYLPSSFLSTDYDFVYVTCGNNQNRYYPYDCADYLNGFYKVENGKLTTGLVQPSLQPPPTNLREPLVNSRPYAAPITHLFLHDSQKNEGREITLAEAQTLTLSGLITSPDGVSVESGYNRDADFFPFFNGSSQYGYYLTKGSKRQKLNLVGEDERNYYYRNNFKFIGWVTPLTPY